MPNYDYQCTACNHRFEMRQGFDSDPVQPCPVCHSTAHRRIHAVGVIYKGSGWYSTDYGRSSVDSPSSNGSDTHDSASPASAPSSPPETTPEAKEK